MKKQKTEDRENPFWADEDFKSAKPAKEFFLPRS
jgi:hypothetical protein